MIKKPSRLIHSCECDDCRRYPRGALAKLHASINRVVAELDERARRLFVGLYSTQLGRGGVQLMATITGIDRTTIWRGRQELKASQKAVDGRVRGPGGGRKPTEKNRRTSLVRSMN
jgi:hypothetical protein